MSQVFQENSGVHREGTTMRFRDKIFGRAKEYSVGREQEDFFTLHPTGVLVLSPLPSEKLDKEWLFKFLAIALGSYLNHQNVNESLRVLLKFVQEGLVFAIQGETVIPEVNELYCEQAVKQAFPHLKDERFRLRIISTDDPLHSNARTIIVWVFPR